MPRADWNVLQDYKLARPTEDLLELFQSIFEKGVEAEIEKVIIFYVKRIFYLS